MASTGLALLLLSGCALPGAAQATPTVDINAFVTLAAATAFVKMTAAAAAFSTPSPAPTLTETPVPAPTEVIWPTNIPTIVPIPGVMRANANVRGVPAKSKTHDLGGLLMDQPVKVIGRNDAATWLYILYADSPTGTGWVTAKAITLDGELGRLPILLYPFGEDGAYVMLPPLDYTVQGTPLPPGTPPPDWDKWGTLTQIVNVRVGPSVGYLSIGRLNPGQIVTFTGRIAENAWVQIDYPSGPDGRGWILSELVQPHDGFGRLPYYNVMGTPIATEAEAPQATEDPNAAPAPTETPAPTSPPITGAEAEVTTQVNLRAGPAQAYPSLGMLNAKEKVVITGLTVGGVWYQIQAASSPTGFAWVAAEYVRVLGDLRGLPVYNNEGTQVPGN
jgi:uncharacterized protein YraI